MLTVNKCQAWSEDVSSLAVAKTLWQWSVITHESIVLSRFAHVFGLVEINIMCHFPAKRY